MKIFNQNALNDLDADTKKAIFGIFLSDSSKYINDLELLVNKKKYYETQRLAHKLKGAALSVGAEKLASIAKNLEDLSHEKLIGDTSELKESFEELKHYLTENKLV